MNFIPDNIIRAVCWTLLHSLWQGLILAVVAGAVMVFTRKAKSTTRYNLLGILVLAFLVVSGYTFSHELRLPSGTEVAVPKVATAADVAVPVVVVHEAPGLRDVSPLESLVRYFNEHASMVVVIWFIIAMARFVKVLSSLVYAQRIRHYGTVAAPAEWQERVGELLGQLSRNRHVLLLESKLIQVPAVVGFLKPVILVPVGMLAQLPADQVESILLHELAHICRRDYLFNVVQYLVDTLFFFNPALLWVSSLIRTERENCCDDVAIRETRSRRQLIEALLSFHEYQKKTRGYTLAFAGKDGGVVKRVERIVHKKNHSLNPGERTLLMGGLLLLCGAFVTIRPSSAPVTAVVIKAKMVAAPEAAVVVLGAAMLPGVVAAGEPGVVRGGEPGVVTAGEPGVVRGGEPGVGAQLADTNIKDEKNDTSLPGHLSDRDIEKLIEARDHGVTPEFVAELKKMGYSLNLDKAIELKDHGVSAEFIQSLKKEGFGQVSLDRAIELIDHGVSVEFIKHIRAAGFPKLTLEQAVELVDHGVNGEFIEKWKKKTGTLLELEDYVHLRDSGIDPS
ncbi:MAG TPA: M56 family metallopeptidase [Puia sp.]|jgi:beta-lactamase regulating signal transducer with metallopeptidase domain|nr:M56 family metallopeptidase [Puia sp.]